MIKIKEKQKITLSTYYDILVNGEEVELPEGIKDIRDQLGYSQVEFAGELGCSVWTVRAWEQGQRNISIENLVAIRKLVEGKNV